MAEMDATRTCVVCGVLFPRNGKTLMCSPECVAARYREYQRRDGRVKGPQQLTCKHCQRPFLGVASKVYCSVKCKDAERRTTPAWAESSKRKRLRRKSTAGVDRNRDRSREFADRKRNRADESAKRMGEDALTGIALTGSARYEHIPALLARVVRLAGRIDMAAKAVKARAFKPRGALSQHTLNLRADRDRYAREITRTRAKSYLRKTGKTMPDDGTVSTAVLLGGARCLYCDCALNDDNRSHDHMLPLCLGGVHSAANIAPACKSCNFSKGRKSIERFVLKLSEKNRRRAVAFYEDRNGPLFQMGLPLAA